MQVPAVIVPALETARALDVGEGRFIKVRGAAKQTPHLLRNRLLGAGRRLAGRQCVFGGEYRYILVPSGRQLARHDRVELRRVIRISLGIAGETLVPCRLEFRAALDAFAELRERDIRNVEIG